MESRLFAAHFLMPTNSCTSNKADRTTYSPCILHPRRALTVPLTTIPEPKGMSRCVSPLYRVRLNFNLDAISSHELVEDLASWAFPACCRPKARGRAIRH